MVPRRLGRTDLMLTPIGFGAFKIGRNQGVKYARQYELPSDAQVEQLLRGVMTLGINYIDTAPAYGLSEQRVGGALTSHGISREPVVISTKVGEAFEDGVSKFDFSEKAVRDSIARSRDRLKADVLNLVFVHSSGDDLVIQNQTDVVKTLRDLRERGEIRAIGFSGKAVEGARAALNWADAIMVEYHLDDRSHESVIREAAEAGIGVIVKKGLASGRLPARAAVKFVLENQGVTSMVIGTLNLDHLRANVEAANSTLTRSTPM